MDDYQFGYPNIITCRKCTNKPGCEHEVKPYYSKGGTTKLMLVGQDPTISNKERQKDVTTVLMLDKDNGSLSRWLKDLIGKDNLNNTTIYATNAVKCVLEKFPSGEDNPIKYLLKYYVNCRDYLKNEINIYQPDILLSFGETTHTLLRSILDNPQEVEEKMKKAYDGEFRAVSVNGNGFKYSPCLHIKTYRVAETYGNKVAQFKTGFDNLLKNI